MANNKKITDLPSRGAADSVDVFAIVDVVGSVTTKITRNQLFGTPGPMGADTPNTGDFSTLQLNGGNSITEISTDGTLIGDSDTAVPTEQAVKTYVDAAVGTAVKLNIIHTSVDSTAVISDVLLVDTASGDIEVELIPTGLEGKIVVYKNSPDANDVIIIPASGATLDSGTVAQTITIGYGSFEFVCDGVDFYTI